MFQANDRRTAHNGPQLARLALIMALVWAQVEADPNADSYEFIGCTSDETNFLDTNLLDKVYFGNEAGGSFALAVNAAAGAPLFAVSKDDVTTYGHGFAFQELKAGTVLDSDLPGCKQECSDFLNYYCGTSKSYPNSNEYGHIWAVYQMVQLDKKRTPSAATSTTPPAGPAGGGHHGAAVRRLAGAYPEMDAPTAYAPPQGEPAYVPALSSYPPGQVTLQTPFEAPQGAPAYVPQPSTTEMITDGQARCEKIYVVQSGDICYNIAISNGMTLQELEGMNPGLCGPQLQPNTWLCMRLTRNEGPATRAATSPSQPVTRPEPPPPVPPPSPAPSGLTRDQQIGLGVGISGLFVACIGVYFAWRHWHHTWQTHAAAQNNP